MLPPENTPATTEVPNICSPDSLAEILSLISTDADRAAGEYLEETVVPHGGE